MRQVDIRLLRALYVTRPVEGVRVVYRVSRSNAREKNAALRLEAVRLLRIDRPYGWAGEWELVPYATALRTRIPEKSS